MSKSLRLELNENHTDYFFQIPTDVFRRFQNMFVGLFIKKTKTKNKTKQKTHCPFSDTQYKGTHCMKNIAPIFRTFTES